MGLSAFGIQELEIAPSLREPHELREWTWDLARNLIDRRPVLNDGDTVGRSAHERVLVRHARSMDKRNAQVYRLEGL